MILLQIEQNLVQRRIIGDFCVLCATSQDKHKKIKMQRGGLADFLRKTAVWGLMIDQSIHVIKHKYALRK